MAIDAQNLTVRQIRVAIVSVVVMAVIGVGNLYITYENVKLNREFRVEKEVRESWERQNRVMLNARAEIQTILIEAATKGRPLTPEEVVKVNRLWIPAEYDIDKRPVK